MRSVHPVIVGFDITWFGFASLIVEPVVEIDKDAVRDSEKEVGECCLSLLVKCGFGCSYECSIRIYYHIPHP